jgi:hypothetical protein
LPVIELLHGYFGITKGDDPLSRRDRISKRLSELDTSLEAVLPYMYALLEIEDDKERLAGMDPQLRRSRTLDAVVRVLLSEAMRRPLILVVEDLHWLDDESQALLDLLVEAMANARILLLVNYRPEYELHWGVKPYCHLLRLGPLAEDSADEMLSAILGESIELLPLKQLIIETTDGTPFFMEETVQALFDEGSLKRSDGTVALVKPLASLRIPPTVQTILAAASTGCAPMRKPCCKPSRCSDAYSILTLPKPLQEDRTMSSIASSPTCSSASSFTNNLRSLMSNTSSSTHSHRRLLTIQSCWRGGNSSMKMRGMRLSCSTPPRWRSTLQTWRTTTHAAPIEQRPSNI